MKPYFWLVPLELWAANSSARTGPEKVAQLSKKPIKEITVTW